MDTLLILRELAQASTTFQEVFDLAQAWHYQLVCLSQLPGQIWLLSKVPGQPAAQQVPTEAFEGADSRVPPEDAGA